MKVLCVIKDNNELARTIVAMRELGHEALWAKSEGEAKTRLAASIPDVVLVDSAYQLPEVLSLVTLVRAMDAKRYVFVLLMTTAASDGILQPAYEAGCDGDFRKGATTAQWSPRLGAIARILNAPTIGKVRSIATSTTAADAGAPVDAGPLSPAEAIARSATWQNLTRELSAVASSFLTVPVAAGPAESEIQGLGIATGIVLSNVEQQTEVRIALATDKNSASHLTVHLFGEDTLDLEADMLNELANMSMGALKTGFGRDTIRFTGGLPEPLGLDRFYRYGAACQRQESFTLVIQGAKILVRVGIATKQNQMVALAVVCEGMVLAKDVFNAQGMLMLRAGTRLSSTAADRLRAALEPKRSIEVAMGAA
jgi:CheY-like chemotaxis protein